MAELTRNLTILGATGSIGVNTLDVIARHPQRFKIIALSAHRQIDRLYQQCLQFSPSYAVVARAADADALQQRLSAEGCRTQVWFGAEALERIAALPEVDTVMAAIVGAAGLRSALAAARTGKKILLANKEALVMAGPVFMAEVRRHRATLLPIDSEHNAIFQSLPSHNSGELDELGVTRILLTASGGPFRETALSGLRAVTPDQACAHPNWVMGRKISVDSATMMNKGLEVIEAHWLFGIGPDRIDVVIHPQSVIHSLVEYRDGSVIAQLGNPDMRTPIAHALAYPDRIDAGVKRLDLASVGRLTFEHPDETRFPCLGLAFRALREGGTSPAVLNAANEVAVAAFLAGELSFTAIAGVIEETLSGLPPEPVDTLDQVFAADARARELAHLAAMRQGRAVS
jgi:1-deoxy-D-xylulose-5-phosphate reductoisomerase